MAEEEKNEKLEEEGEEEEIDPLERNKSYFLIINLLKIQK